MTTGVFLAALKNTHNRDGDLILTGVQPLFSSLLEFHGVNKYFNCKKDLAEAIEYIKNKDRTR
jgi:anti-anti-sigma regulatory factor